MVPFLRIRIRPELKSSKLSGIVLTLNHKMKIKLLAFSSIDGCDGIIIWTKQCLLQFQTFCLQRVSCLE